MGGLRGVPSRDRAMASRIRIACGEMSSSAKYYFGAGCFQVGSPVFGAGRRALAMPWQCRIDGLSLWQILSLADISILSKSIQKRRKKKVAGLVIIELIVS